MWTSSERKNHANDVWKWIKWSGTRVSQSEKYNYSFFWKAQLGTLSILRARMDSTHSRASVYRLGCDLFFRKWLTRTWSESLFLGKNVPRECFVQFWGGPISVLWSFSHMKFDHCAPFSFHNWDACRAFNHHSGEKIRDLFQRTKKRWPIDREPFVSQWREAVFPIAPFQRPSRVQRQSLVSEIDLWFFTSRVNDSKSMRIRIRLEFVKRINRMAPKVSGRRDPSENMKGTLHVEPVRRFRDTFETFHSFFMSSSSSSSSVTSFRPLSVCHLNVPWSTSHFKLSIEA